MSIFLLIINYLFVCAQVNVNCLSLSKKIVDSKIGDDSLLHCPIDRNNWTHPTIFQWYRSTNNYTVPIASQFDDYPIHIDGGYRDRYSLFSNRSLKITNIQLSDNDTFECRLILIDRGLLDTKEKYFLTLRVNEPPRFLNQSESIQIARQHSSVNFSCEIYAVPNPTVTWYKVIQKDQQTIGEEDLQLMSVNSQHFALQNVDDRMAGRYRCIGKNRLGFIQNEFQLLIRGSIYWRHFPKSQTVKINDSITFRCEGESTETLQYQWLKDNGSLSDGISSQGRIRTFSDGVLNINHIEPSDHGSYVCIISISNSSTIQSKPALITVKYPPMPSRRRQSNNLTLVQDSLGICPCLLDAYPPIQSVSWYRNGKSIRIQSRGGNYTINTEYALVIKSAEKDNHNGAYFCRAQNSEGFGRDSLPIYIEVKEPIKFLSKPNSMYHVHETDRLVLPCVVFGNPQPTIKWFKNSMDLNEVNQNLTLEYIEKTDHGLYVCQASNEYTTTNISTLIIVENTTPQAPLNVRSEQISSNLLLSWEPGYNGGRSQHFIVWYRMIQSKKQNWNQIRVIPNNATAFLVFDLKVQQTYEVTIIAENDHGLGIFSPIISIYLNNDEDLSIGYLHHSNETDLLRPLPPTHLHLSHSGSNLYITWNHPNLLESPMNIVYYVIQWRTTIFFNNQQSQQFIVVQHPSRSYILKDIKQSKYMIEIMSYSDQGIYSSPMESEINIQFNSILAYHGSSRLLISIICFLTVLTVAILCICVFFILKCYYDRGSYFTDHKSDSKFTCGCFPLIQYKPDECSPIEPDRYHTSLLKSIDLQSSPIYASRHRVTPRTTASSLRSPSPLNSFTESSISLAKVATIPRCRDSVISNTMTIPQLTQNLSSTENSRTIVSPALSFAVVPTADDDTQMTSFFQPISIGNASPIFYGDFECRRNSSRLPLEAVPELSELHLANSRYSYAQSLSSAVHIPPYPNLTQPSPVLITFDSSSLQRRT